MELLLQEYEKLGIIGRGGFATVWKVRHHQFRNIRAIKELHEPIYDNDSKLYKSFCKESETLLRLGNGGHPNIIKIFRSILYDHRAYLEMDFVEGETLYNYLREKKFVPINEVMKFVSDIGSALAYCHEDIYLFCMDREIDDLLLDTDDASKVLIDDAKRKELIDKYKVWHNDIQSKNVMRKINGSYMLFDFGLSVSDEGEITSSKKKNGIVEYMSPEKLDKGIFDARSDVYSFGILMYEILAGRVPFEIEDGKNREAISEQVKILEKHKNAMPPAIEPLRRAAFEAVHQGKTYEKDYPDWLEQMIMKCLEKKPENRYATAKEFFMEFEKNDKESRLEDSEQTKKLKESNEKMIKDLSNLSREKNELNEQVIELNGQIIQLAKQLAKSSNREEENIQLHSKVNEFETDNNNLKILNDNLFKEVTTLKDESTFHLQMIENLHTQLIALELEKAECDNTKSSVTPDCEQKNLTDPEMVFVDGGTFLMGCNNEQESNNYEDDTMHSVMINSFYIAKYPVTQMYWQAYMDNNPSYFNGDNLPVERVSWEEAQEFIRRLNAATGKQYRLPTEAEWEYAARGGNKSHGFQYSGDNNLNNVAWYEYNSGMSTHPVGTKLPNELGIYDMSGNVWEWCSDWYDPNYYLNSQQVDPSGPSSGSLRVIRGGGSCYGGSGSCSVYDRSNSPPSRRNYNLGFRLACS